MVMKMEKKCPQGVVCPFPGAIYIYIVYDHNIPTSSLKPLGQSKPNIKWSIVRRGVKVNINGPGHMTKMATMAINSKTIINLFLQNRKTYDFETWLEASMNTALQSLYKS